MLFAKKTNADMVDAWLQFFNACTNFDGLAPKIVSPAAKMVWTIDYSGGKTEWKQVAAS